MDNNLLKIPIRELKKCELSNAFAAYDERIAEIRKINESFISKRPKSIQILTHDSFEPFQSPCDTNVIITNERERQDDMKKHNCIDAREFIPHGKTSLLDGKL